DPRREGLSRGGLCAPIAIGWRETARPCHRSAPSAGRGAFAAPAEGPVPPVIASRAGHAPHRGRGRRGTCRSGALRRQGIPQDSPRSATQSAFRSRERAPASGAPCRREEARISASGKGKPRRAPSALSSTAPFLHELVMLLPVWTPL